METIAFNLERYSVKREHQPRSEREELLDKFLLQLNPPRIEAGLKPLTHVRLATILTGIPTSDLYGFYKSCERARSFSKLFWHLLKPKA